MKRAWLILLLLSLPAQAAQVISQACIDEVAQHLEPRFTFNPTEKRLYAWERHIIRTPGYFNNYADTHYCLLYYIIPNPMMDTAAFPISNATSGLLITWASNPKSRTSFKTNGSNFEQESLDWCTQ